MKKIIKKYKETTDSIKTKQEMRKKVRIKNMSKELMLKKKMRKKKIKMNMKMII